jgi:hypothetical protein
MTTPRDQSNPPASPDWPIFDNDDPALPKGLPAFRARRSNVLNLQHNGAITWQHEYLTSKILTWRDKDAVDLIFIGRLAKASLMNAHSEYKPEYRLAANLDKDTTQALQAILARGPLQDEPNVNPPIAGRTVKFSAKLAALQKSDAPDLDIDDPFPFVFDGREMSPTRRSHLMSYSTDQLSHDDIIAIEANLLSYQIARKGEEPERNGYTLSLRAVYFLAGKSMDFDGSGELSSKTLKRQGDCLVSPRKNKRPGQVAVFSDGED